MALGMTVALLVIAALILGALLSLLLVLRLARRGASPADVQGDAWDQFERTLDAELERARRLERPLTLIRVPIDSDTGAHEGPSPLSRVALRRIDHSFVLGRAAFLIAPGTGLSSRRALVDRLLAARDGQHPSSVRASTFPDEGLSSGALLARLEEPNRRVEPDTLTERRAITDQWGIA